jgi:hypothetical protein
MIFHRRLLILGYLSGLQIWDCTNLDSITELLNVSSSEWGRVFYAEVLPSPRTATGDEFYNSRPVLGIMCGSGSPYCLLSTNKVFAVLNARIRGRTSLYIPFQPTILSRKSLFQA